MSDDTRDAVRAQYGSVGDAYVTSTTHAEGPDLERMIELARPDSSTRMLDVATGGGHVVRAFSPHVKSIVATDLTPQMIQHASAAFTSWGVRNVTTQIVDAEQMPYENGVFDLVTCRIAPHHFGDIHAFLAESHRVLAGNGQLLLIDSTPPDGDAGDWINRFDKLRDPSHVRALSIAEWCEALSSAGFIVHETESFPKTHDFAEWVSRSRTPRAAMEELVDMARSAAPAIAEQFALAFDGGRFVSFQDVKTLFRATLA